MSSIKIQRISITDFTADAVVNAANSDLAQGAGVCGFIFRDAGADKMTAACRKIGHCPTGSAVITPGFDLPAKNVIHAVGPVWYGGNRKEPELLYSAYKSSLTVAKENGLHSIGFPLISAGIYGYPQEQAWERAITACRDFISENPDHEIDITFCVLDDSIMKKGEKILGSNGL